MGTPTLFLHLTRTDMSLVVTPFPSLHEEGLISPSPSAPPPPTRSAAPNSSPRQVAGGSRFPQVQ